MINGRNNRTYTFSQYLAEVNDALDLQCVDRIGWRNRTYEFDEVVSCYDGELTPNAAASYIGFMRPTLREMHEIHETNKRATGRYNRRYRVA